MVPSVIPLAVYARQASWWLFRIVRHSVRFWLAIMVWLIQLPISNMTTLRSMVWLADQMFVTFCVCHNLTDVCLRAKPSLQLELSHELTSNVTTTAGIIDIGIKANTTESAEGRFVHDLIMKPTSSLSRLLSNIWQKWYRGDTTT